MALPSPAANIPPVAHSLKLLVAFVVCLVFAAPASAGTVFVTPSISGAGTITGGAGCSRSGVPNGTLTPCATTAGNTIVVLTATPNGNGTFTRWDGSGCTGQGNQCLMVDGSPGGVSSFAPRAVFTDSVGPSLGTPAASLSTTVNNTVDLSWTTNETLTSAECRIDGAARTCTGLTTHTATLAEGLHTFRVRGTDINGNVGALSAETSFRIIDTSFVSTPAAASNDKNPTFVFSSVTGVTFDCRLDAAAFADCGAKVGANGRLALTNLADGTHTFRVRARDLSEFDRVPATFTWTVDTVAPIAALGASGPGEGALQAVSKETFVFSSNEDGTFECQLDGAGFAPCASGITLEGLSATAHRFEVRAVDAAGNVGPAVARNWTVFAFPTVNPSPGPAPAAQEPPVQVTLAFFVKASKKTTRFSTLQIKNVPLNATVAVTCAGKGCPSGLKGKGFTKTKAFGTVTLAKFIKKPLKAGDKITVTVTKPNAVGAVKVLTVRAGKKPLIATKCLPPGTAKPVAC